MLHRQSRVNISYTYRDRLYNRRQPNACQEIFEMVVECGEGVEGSRGAVEEGWMAWMAVEEVEEVLKVVVTVVVMAAVMVD